MKNNTQYVFQSLKRGINIKKYGAHLSNNLVLEYFTSPTTKAITKTVTIQ